jgi:nitrous oxidase accessory protein
MKPLIIISLLFIHVALSASTIEVGQGKKYNSIKAAIGVAKDGDEILISKGVYGEGEIMINKQIRVRGIDWPVIDGKSKAQIFTIAANRVVIEGLEIRNAGYSSSYDWAAIKVIDANNVLIRDNRLLNNTFGIYLQNTSACTIVNNLVQGNPINEVQSGNAIHCWKSDKIKISGNTVSGHRDGIYFEFVTNSLIENNNSFKNIRYGLHFMFSHSDTYLKNTFRSNGAGVAVMFSKNVTMRLNHFEENWGSASYGILMKEISDGIVEQNTFLKNTMGIYMEGTSRVNVNRNTFKANGWAMRVQASCVDNNITQNNFIGNTFDVGTNGITQLNKFEMNYWDKYEGYDLNKDGYGDVHFLPVSLYSMIVEKIPAASILLRSFMVSILDKAERLIPSITPIELKDDKPLMKPLSL